MANDPVEQTPPADQPLIDRTPYGAGPDASVTDTTESAAVTHHVATVGGKSFPYMSRAGHLVTVDPSTAQPNAKFFYVSFTADGLAPSERPVTFFYNGGPGSSAVFLPLGSFAPRRIKTSLPEFTPPAPYTIEDNPDTLLDQSDLVFINPVNHIGRALVGQGHDIRLQHAIEGRRAMPLGQIESVPVSFIRIGMIYVQHTEV